MMEGSEAIQLMPNWSSSNVLQMKPNIVGFLALADFIWRAALLLKKMLLPLAVCPRFPVLDGVAHDAHLELVGVSRWDRVLRMYTIPPPTLLLCPRMLPPMKFRATAFLRRRCKQGMFSTGFKCPIQLPHDSHGSRSQTKSLIEITASRTLQKVFMCVWGGAR